MKEEYTLVQQFFRFQNVHNEKKKNKSLLILLGLKMVILLHKKISLLLEICT